MVKLPKLNEVFLAQNRNIMNVGSAYSLRETDKSVSKKPTSSSPLAGHVIRSMARNRSRKMMSEAGFDDVSLAPGKKLKPEFEKMVKDTATNILSKAPDQKELEDMLRDMMHGVEEAEGEDPAELDAGGPPGGSTGGK